jgi:hypothetical protein
MVSKEKKWKLKLLSFASIVDKKKTGPITRRNLIVNSVFVDVVGADLMMMARAMMVCVEIVPISRKSSALVQISNKPDKEF